VLLLFSDVSPVIFFLYLRHIQLKGSRFGD
jgi:hypothetical protein